MRRGMLILTPSVWWANGLLNEGLYEYHALKVGSVDPFATARWWSVLALSTDCIAALKSGRASRACWRTSSRGGICLEKSNGPVTSNWSTGVRSFRSMRSWIFCGLQTLFRDLQVGFVLHSL